MSYDLMVFEPVAAPKGHAQFLAWYREQTTWREDQSYDDPAVSSARLRAFFADLHPRFPPLNGPYASEELPEDEESATDYAIGPCSIYACFSGSRKEPAHRAAFELAAKHGLGFFNAGSDEEDVWLPKGSELVLAHKKVRQSWFSRIFK